jgi:glycosidase
MSKKTSRIRTIVALLTFAVLLTLLVSCGVITNRSAREQANGLSFAEKLGMSSDRTTRNGSGEEVILQAWHWGSANKVNYGNSSVSGGWYTFLKDQLNDIRTAGFTVLYLPPPWRDDSSWYTDETRTIIGGGGEGYYWHSQTLDSRYGTRQDLQDLIDEAKEKQLKVIFDMVPNHCDRYNPNGVNFLTNSNYDLVNVIDYTINDKTIATETNELAYFDTKFKDLNGTVFSGYDMDSPKGWFDYVKNTSTAYGSDINLFTPNDPDRNNSGQGYMAIQHGMQQLVDMGADGWRWDYVHGLPAELVDQWIVAVGDQDLSIGELARDDYEKLLSWASGDSDGSNGSGAATGGANSTVFDFLLKRAIVDHPYAPKFWGGLATDVYGHNRARAVTFVKNHDTDVSPGRGIEQTREGHLGIETYETDPATVHWAYAYILLMPGTPCVYFPDWFGDYPGETPVNWTALISARNESGISSSSFVEQYNGDPKWYVWDNDTGSGDPTLAFSLGTDWDPNRDKSMSLPLSWNSSASAWPNGIRVWNRASVPDSTTTTSIPTTTTTVDPDDGIRTVIYMHIETESGEDLYLKGGHDDGLVAQGHYPTSMEPITYLNFLDPTTLSLKQNDQYLDWGDDWSALNWTCKPGSSSWHANNNQYYHTVGSGIDSELDTYNVLSGDDPTWHWWKFDVLMQGNVGDWFEFKGYLNGGQGWESNIDQGSTPHDSHNHWGKKGYITKCAFNADWVEFIQL